MQSSVEQLVLALRDDEISWNAIASSKELVHRMQDPAHYGPIHRSLERALVSSDEQQRRIATGMLQSLSSMNDPPAPAYVPSENLLDRAVEELHVWWSGSPWIWGDVNQRKSIAFAIDHIDRMEGRLIRKVMESEGRYRFLHSYILAREGRTQFADVVVPVLVEHLRDNHIRDDALMSMEGLFRLGKAATPWLHDAFSTADDQQRACIELLLLELADPALTREARAERRELNVVTWKCDDPVQSWRYPVLSEY